MRTAIHAASELLSGSIGRARAVSYREPQTGALLFDVLFIRTLRPEGGFLENLRAAGFDPALPPAGHPARLFAACLLVAHPYCYPHLEAGQAARKLGQRFMAALPQNLASRLLALPRRGADGQLKSMVGLMRREVTDARVELKRLAPRHYRVELPANASVLADFCSGLLDEGLRQAGVEPRVAVLEFARTFAIDVRW